MEQMPEVRNLGDVRWLSIEDKQPGRGTGRWIACFILDPEKKPPKIKKNKYQYRLAL